MRSLFVVNHRQVLKRWIDCLCGGSALKAVLRCPTPLAVCIILTLCLLGQPSSFVQADTSKRHPNVLLICVDDLRPELACYGKDYISSPNIDQLASRARIFGRHYVQAPTCGASRYTLLTGQYGPGDNGALFQRAKRLAEGATKMVPTMPSWFRSHGYTTVSVGKVSHHPGGRGGSDWDDNELLEMPESWDRHLLPAGPWQHPRGAMHGLANGEMRKNAKEMEAAQAKMADLHSAI